MFGYSVCACFIGFFIDFVFGDPHFLYHPVRLIGRLISFCERNLRKIFHKSESELKMAGVFLVMIVSSVTVGGAFIICFFAYWLNVYFGIAVESVLCYFCLAAKSLKVESMKVYDEISKGDINGAKRALSMIVGRDTDRLDEKGIIKAAVETIAENLSDGVIAPMLYMLIGGGVFGAFYKAVNTMDSMVGYKNEKYLFFGRCAAGFDDFMNYIPSRISAVMIIFASFILGMDYKGAFRIFKRDRFNHSSPNSAQTESACAGALRIQLAGNAYYFGKLYEKPFIGDDIEEVVPENIIDANRLMYTASILTICLFGGGFLLLISLIS